jgi:hypothetical protein
VHIRFLQAGVHLRKGDLRRALSVAEPQLRQAELLGAPFGLDTFRISDGADADALRAQRRGA